MAAHRSLLFGQRSSCDHGLQYFETLALVLAEFGAQVRRTGHAMADLGDPGSTDLCLAELRRWLRQARDIQWNYGDMVERKRRLERLAWWATCRAPQLARAA